MKWTRNEILVGFVSAALGMFVGAGLMYWGRLPDHTIDLLTFTESAFGIGMTVLALLFALGLLSYRAEIDQMFERKSVEIEKKTEEALRDMKERVERMERTYEKMIDVRTEAGVSGVLIKEGLLKSQYATVNEQVATANLPSLQESPQKHSRSPKAKQ